MDIYRAFDADDLIELAHKNEAEIARLKAEVEGQRYTITVYKETEAQLTTRVKELEAENRRVNSELRKWERPFDQERFDAIKEQASHKDSLAAQLVYIIALEHALKHQSARIKELTDNTEERNKEYRRTQGRVVYLTNRNRELNEALVKYKP